MEAFGLYIIILYFVGLFFLFIVIETAVKRGINNSIIGDFLKKSMELKMIKNLFLMMI
jgi:hypothetical protein